MAVPSVVKLGRTTGGFCVRVEGRGTMRESPAVAEFVEQSLRVHALATPGCAAPVPSAVVVVDLTNCDYLDSTFLGCLLGLHQRFAMTGPAEQAKPFSIVAPPAKSKALFGPTRLDKLLNALPSAPTQAGEWVELSTAQLPPREMTRHVMECHRKLAQVEGPSQAAFARIADGMEQELRAKEEEKAAD